MAVLSAVSIAEIKARGSIKDADVLKVRRNYYDDGSITAEEADAILALNDACPVQDPAWADCFIETITGYLVEQAPPQGYLTAENAQWLIDRISRDGRIETKTVLELLVNVLDKARWAPQSLVRFALEQVKAAVNRRHGAAAFGQEARARPRLRGRRRSPAPHALRLRRRRQHRHHQARGRGPVRHQRRHRRSRQPSGLDRSLRQGDRQLRYEPPQDMPSRRARWRSPVKPGWTRRGDLTLDALILAGMASGVQGLFGSYRQQSQEERAVARLTQQKIKNRNPRGLSRPPRPCWLAERIGRDGRAHPQ